MALPKINDVPKYSTVIPSTGKTIHFRPFLVKEQKVLLIALESQDQKNILKAMVDTLKSCVDESVDFYNLATFDIEYLFTKIRSKSVGETVEVMMSCEKCEAETPVKINLDDIKIEVPTNNKVIQLTDKAKLIMKYPSYSSILNLEDKSETTAVDVLYKIILSCLDVLQVEDEQFKIGDETAEEQQKFLEALNQDQFRKINDFVNTLPRLQHDIHYNCAKCKHPNKTTIQGLDDFF
jgi:hypothetical protein